MAKDSSVPLRKFDAFSTLTQFGKIEASLTMADSPNNASDLNAQLRYLLATKDTLESQTLERKEILTLAASISPFLSSQHNAALSIACDIMKTIDLSLDEGMSLELGKQYCQALADSSPVALDYFLHQITHWLEQSLANTKRLTRVSARSHTRLSRINPNARSGVPSLEGPIIDPTPNDGVYFKQVQLPSSLVNQFITSQLFLCLSVAVQTHFRRIEVQWHVALWLALCRSNPTLLERYSEYLTFFNSLSEAISTYPLPMPREYRQVMEDIFLAFTVSQLEILAKDPNSDSNRSSAARLGKVLSSQWQFSLSLDSYRSLDKGCDPVYPEELAYPSEQISSVLQHCWPSFACDVINYIIDLATFQLEHIDTIIELILTNLVPKTMNKSDRIELLVLLSQYVPSLVKRYREPMAPSDGSATASKHDQFTILKSLVLALDFDSKVYHEYLSEDEALQVICWLSHALETSLWTSPSSTGSTFDETLMTLDDFQAILKPMVSIHDAFELTGTKLAKVTFNASFRPWHHQPAIIEYLVSNEFENPHLIKLRSILFSYLSSFNLKSPHELSKICSDDQRLARILQSPVVHVAILGARLKDVILSPACPSPTQIKVLVESIHQSWSEEEDFRIALLEQSQFGGRLAFLSDLTHLTLFLAAYNDTATTRKRDGPFLPHEIKFLQPWGNSFIVPSLLLLDFPLIPASSHWKTNWFDYFYKHQKKIGEWLAGASGPEIDPNPNFEYLNEFVEFDWHERMNLLKKGLEVLGSVWESIPLNKPLPCAENSILARLTRTKSENHAFEELATSQARWYMYALRPFCLASIYPCPSVNKFALTWLTNVAWKRLIPASALKMFEYRELAQVTREERLSLQFHLKTPIGGYWLPDFHQNMFLMHYNDPITISKLVSAMQSFMLGERDHSEKIYSSINKSVAPMLFHYCMHLRGLLTDPMKWELENILRPTHEVVPSVDSDGNAPTPGTHHSPGTMGIRSPHGYVLPPRREKHSNAQPSSASSQPNSPTNTTKKISSERDTAPDFSYLNSYLETGNWTDFDELAWFTFPTLHLPTTRCTPTDFRAHLSRHEDHFSMQMPKTHRPFVHNVDPAILREFLKVLKDGDDNKLQEKRRQGINERAKIYIDAFCEAIASMSEFLSKVALAQAYQVPILRSTEFKTNIHPTNPSQNQIQDSKRVDDPLYYACFAAIMLSEFYAGDDISSFRNSNFKSRSSPDSNEANHASSPKIDAVFLESDTLIDTTWKVFGSLMKMPEAFDLTIKVPIGLATLQLLKIDSSKQTSVLETSHPMWLSSILPVISSVAPYLGKSIYEPYATSSPSAASSSPDDNKAVSSSQSEEKTKSNKRVKKNAERNEKIAEKGSLASLMADYFISLMRLVNVDLDEMVLILQKVAENRLHGALVEHQLPSVPLSAIDPSLSISMEEEAQGRSSSGYARIQKWNSRMDRLGYYLQMMVNLISFNIPINKEMLLYGSSPHEHIGDPKSGTHLDGLHGPFLQNLMSSVHMLSLTEGKLPHRPIIARMRENRVTLAVQSLLIHVFSTPADAVKAVSHPFWNLFVGPYLTQRVTETGAHLAFWIAKLMSLSGCLEGDTDFPVYRSTLSAQLGTLVACIPGNALYPSFSMLPIITLATHYQHTFKDWQLDRCQPRLQDHVLICFLCDISNGLPGTPQKMFKQDLHIGPHSLHAFHQRLWFADANETKAGNRFLPSYSDNPNIKRYSSALYESERLAAAKRGSYPVKASSSQHSASGQSSDHISLEPDEITYPTLYLGVPKPASAQDSSWKAYSEIVPVPRWNWSFPIYSLHAQRMSMGMAKQKDLLPGDLKSYNNYSKKLKFNVTKTLPPPLHSVSAVSYDISKENFKSNGLVVTMVCSQLDTTEHVVLPTNRIVNVWWPTIEVGKVNDSDRTVFSLQMGKLLTAQKSILSNFRIGWATAGGLKRLNEQPFSLVGDVKGTFGFSFLESGGFNEGKYIPLIKTTSLGSFTVAKIPEDSPRLDLAYHSRNRSIHAQFEVIPEAIPTAIPMHLSMLLPQSVEGEDLFPVCSFTSPHTFQVVE